MRDTTRIRLAVLLAAAALAAPRAAGQQFQLQAGVLPGPNNEWGEGVAMADVDLDGDLDIVVAQGDGFSGAGTARQQRVLINSGTGTFTDESIARIGTLLLNAKMVITPDVDADGDADLVLAQGFTKQPQILINDGSGVFTNETATRLPVLSIDSFSVEAGDPDNDGDLDLAFSDAGPSPFGAPGGQLRLYQNDGGGFFTDVTASKIPVLLEIGTQDVHFADVDNDFDLDLLNGGKSAGIQLFLNGGTGAFTSSSALGGAGSGSCYEFEPSDFEGDGDLDLFVLGQSGLNDATSVNNLVPGGTLSFTTSTATITGNQGDDDNEAAFIDFDDDGDLDGVIGSLTNNGEKFFTNNGTGTFAYSATAITGGTDSTLDLAFGDLDGDGDLDLYTCQGESGNFADKVYANTGPADSNAPAFPRVEDLPNVSETSTGPWVARAAAADGVYDDGVQWLDADVDWTLLTDSGSFGNEVPAASSGGAVFRGVMTDISGGANLEGAEVQYHFHATDFAGNIGTSATKRFGVCGFANYGAGIAGTAGVPTLTGTGVPHATNSIQVDLAGAAPNAGGLLLVGITDAAIPAYGGQILVGLAGSVAAPIGTDGSGGLSIPLTLGNNPAFAQITFYWQVFVLDAGAPASIAATPGLRMVTCYP